MQDKKNDKLSHMEEIATYVYIFLALILMGINTILCVFTDVNPAICGATFILLYGIISFIIYFVFKRKSNLIHFERNASDEQAGSVIYAFRNQLSVPYAVVNDKGKIITSNAAFSEALGFNETIFNLDINLLCNINLNEFLSLYQGQETDEEAPISEKPIEKSFYDINPKEIARLGKKLYRMESHQISTKGKSYRMIVFTDITELSSIYTTHKNSITAVGYIVIDNLDDIAQYVKVDYQDEARNVEKALKEWVIRLGGVLCEYEKNKFLVLFSQEMLDVCIENKFDILNEVHKIEIGETHIPLTVSMGISTLGNNLDEREHNAMIALDMALQRGGDQVVLKNANGSQYFGAKTKAIQKRTTGTAKIICARLASLLSQAPNVLVMGHRNPDFDCIGACIGITTLIRNIYSDLDVKIVTDVQNENFIACASAISNLPEYKNTFVDGISALDHNALGTLLIIVDANNVNILESPELARTSFKKVFIDHHLKKEEFAEEPKLAYIEPSASSTCELIAEMLEEILPPDALFKEEASIMMSGIMLDTKNFTRNVGIRTFGAALYLRNLGADTEYARTFFEEGFDEYLSVSQFGSRSKIYRKNIAIASIESDGSTNARVTASKVADKLLTVRNIDAAFTLILTDTVVNISARSDGNINVQLILEQLGGGGHFDMAGAAIADTTLEDAEIMLTNAIDKYYENIETTTKKQK